MASEISVSVAQAWNALISDYVLGVQAAIVVYEHIITIDQELALIWRRKWTGATVLFAVNRYNLLLQSILQLTPSVPAEWCIIGVRILNATSLLQYLVFAAFSALRIYAIWGRNMWLCMIVLLFGLVPFGASVYATALTTVKYIGAPDFVCSANDALDIHYNTIEFAARISIIAADTIVVVLTWARTYRDFREAMKLKIGVNVTALLLRDGTLFFCPLLAMNVVILITWSATPLLNSPTVTIQVIFTLTSIMLSRFLFNLREVGQRGSMSSGDVHMSRLSMPAFAQPESRIIGNLGEDVSFDAESDEADEGEGLDATRDDVGSQAPPRQAEPSSEADGCHRNEIEEIPVQYGAT